MLGEKRIARGRSSGTRELGSRRSSGRASRTRQLATRARGTWRRGAPRFEGSREQHEELATRFFATIEEGDLHGLKQLLAHDVVFRGDGTAAALVVHGRATVAALAGRGSSLGPFRRLHDLPRGGERAPRRAVLRSRRQADHWGTRPYLGRDRRCKGGRALGRPRTVTSFGAPAGRVRSRPGAAEASRASAAGTSSSARAGASLPATGRSE
jgi:hypothetical protein